jgi:hypothetical protein
MRLDNPAPLEEGPRALPQSLAGQVKSGQVRPDLPALRCVRSGHWQLLVTCDIGAAICDWQPE